MSEVPAERWHAALASTPEVAADTHIRPTPVEVLAKLSPVFGGVQTGGNSSAIVDGAAAALAASGGYVEKHGKAPLGRLVAPDDARLQPFQAAEADPVDATVTVHANSFSLAEPCSEHQQAAEEHGVDRRQDRSGSRRSGYSGQHGWQGRHRAGHAEHVEELHAAQSGDRSSNPCIR